MKHGRSTGSPSDTVRFGDVNFTVGALDKETPGNLTIAGTGAVATGVSIGNFNIAVDFPGPLEFANFFTQGPIAQPALSPLANGRIYFDQNDFKFKVSENGGPYVDLLGAGGVSGNGIANRIAFWTDAVTLDADNELYWDQSNNRMGIEVTTPEESLDTTGALKIGSADGTADGTIQFTGTDFEGRVAGVWVSLTQGGANDSGWTDTGAIVRLTTATDTVGVGTVTPNGKFHVVSESPQTPLRTETTTTTGTNNLESALVVKRTTTQDMVDGFGPTIQFAIEDNANVEQGVATIAARRHGS
ncbi:MAG: hypothetical protein AAGM67_07865, partial [Bacteroidota bacterium]